MSLWSSTRTMLVLLPVMACAIGCSNASSDADTSDASEADLSSASAAALTAKIKAAYENAGENRETAYIFAGETDCDSSKLHGAALESYSEYQQTISDGTRNTGILLVRTAKVDGFRIYYVAGDVSDTGTELGFYDAKGHLLAQAYEGQGEHPNAAGVDWLK